MSNASRLIFVLGLLAAGAARADAYAAAVLPVMAPDLLEPQKRAIDERIRGVARDNGLALQPAHETTVSIAQAKKAGAACNIETLACQAQMGVLLGTKQVVVARVASDWAGDKLELRLLDALRGSTIREATGRLPKETELRNRVIDGIVLAVLAPKKAGALDITAGDGTLIVDGVQHAVEGGKAHVDALAPGRHDVELRAAGKPAEHATASLDEGKTVAVSIGIPVVDATPPPAAEKPSTGLWLVGGGAVLAAAAGVGAGGLELALETAAMERPTRGALQATGIGLLGATAVGVVVAGAGGVLMAVQQ